jgi:hypothetical protein
VLLGVALIVASSVAKDLESCDEKVRLLHTYEQTARQFAETVGTLNLRIGLSTKSEYILLKNEVEETRLKCEEARIAYENHAREHGC